MEVNQSHRESSFLSRGQPLSEARLGQLANFYLLSSDPIKIPAKLLSHPYASTPSLCSFGIAESFAFQAQAKIPVVHTHHCSAQWWGMLVNGVEHTALVNPSLLPSQWTLWRLGVGTTLVHPPSPWRMTTQPVCSWDPAVATLYLLSLSNYTCILILWYKEMTWWHWQMCAEVQLCELMFFLTSSQILGVFSLPVNARKYAPIPELFWSFKSNLLICLPYRKLQPSKETICSCIPLDNKVG